MENKIRFEITLIYKYKYSSNDWNWNANGCLTGLIQSFCDKIGELNSGCNGNFNSNFLDKGRGDYLHGDYNRNNPGVSGGCL